MSSYFYDVKIGNKNTKLTVGTYDEPIINDKINFYARMNYDNATYFTSNYVSSDSFNSIRNGLDNIEGYETDIYYNKNNDTIRFSTTKDRQYVKPGSSYYTGINLYRMT